MSLTHEAAMGLAHILVLSSRLEAERRKGIL